MTQTMVIPPEHLPWRELARSVQEACREMKAKHGLHAFRLFWRDEQYASMEALLDALYPPQWAGDLPAWKVDLAWNRP